VGRGVAFFAMGFSRGYAAAMGRLPGDLQLVTAARETNPVTPVEGGLSNVTNTTASKFTAAQLQFSSCEACTE
jgi:hypothetical protein